MPKLGATLETLLKKIKVDTTAPELATLLALDTEIDEATAKKLNTELMTSDAAIAHPAVKAALRQSNLQAVDEQMDAIISELKLQPDDAFLTNKNTFEKIGLLGKMIFTHGKKNSGAKTTEEWAEEKKGYEEKLRKMTEDLANEKTNSTTKAEQITTAAALRVSLAGKKYALPKGMAQTRMTKIAFDSVQAKLDEQGLMFKLGAGETLTIVNKDGTPAFDANHVALTPDTFIDAALAGDSLLAINDDNDDVEKKEIITNLGGEKVKGNAAIVAELDQQIADMEKG